MMMTEEEQIATTIIHGEEETLEQYVFDGISRRLSSLPGRSWAIPSSDVTLFFRYALNENFVHTPSWRTLFRISHDLLI